MDNNIKEAVNILRFGGVIIFPTETVYGIGCAYDNKAGIERIYKIKNRPKDKPLQILIYDKAQLDALVSEVPEKAKELIDKYRPGPLTLILKAKGWRMEAGGETVGIRMPDHPISLEIIKELGKPLAATSANLPGDADPASADEVKIKADLLIDGGKIKDSAASTVVDLTSPAPNILREGKIKIFVD